MTISENATAATFAFATEIEFSLFAADFAMALKPGDCVLLHGDLGAGKTTFARAAIRALAGDARIEVPSPTFTLVQTYDLRIRVAHMDLYRLSDPEEIGELGLDDALSAGAAFIEWPERAEGQFPAGAIRLSIAEDPDNPEGRLIAISAPAGFDGRLSRSLSIRRFLAENGWAGAERRFLLGDASTRAYETASRDGAIAVLMNAPRRPAGPPVRDGKPYTQIAHLAEDIIPFVAIDGLLRRNGFRAPEIFAFDLEQGFVLLEHLGSDGILDATGAPDPQRYLACIECLAAMHSVSWTREALAGDTVHCIPDFDLGAFLIEAELLTGWFVPRADGKPLSAGALQSFRRLWAGLFSIVDGSEKTLVLRDFHSPNVIWDGRAEGENRVGLIDFQDALWGPAAYDVASIVQDARVDIPPAMQDRLVDRYCTCRTQSEPAFDEVAFRRDFAILCAQRASKILGIFVRLDERDGKPAYLRHIPRLQSYLRRSLGHPSLAGIGEWYAEHDILDVDMERG